MAAAHDDTAPGWITYDNFPSLATVIEERRSAVLHHSYLGDGTSEADGLNFTSGAFGRRFHGRQSWASKNVTKSM
jgi:hypothetical protein